MEEDLIDIPLKNGQYLERRRRRSVRPERNFLRIFIAGEENGKLDSTHARDAGRHKRQDM